MIERLSIVGELIVQTLSIVTLNTWKCDGDYPRRLRLMCAQLRQLSPDVLLLQESFRADDGSFDTADYVAGQLHMAYRYHAARRKPRELGGRHLPSSSGLAILSASEPCGHGAFRLPDDSRDGERWAQWLDIDRDGVMLRVINTHLCHLSDREDLREQGLRRIVDFVVRECGDRLVLLGGDLNAEPNAQALRWLERQQVRIAHGAWREPGASGPLATHPTSGPESCFDHLYRFGSPLFAACWSEVTRVLDVPDAQGCYASDHVAVLGKLTIQRIGRRWFAP